MIGTLSMISLVVCGAAGVNPVVIVALALANALIGLTPQPVAVAGQAAPCRCNRLARALPQQMLFCTVGYLLGVGFHQTTALM